MKKLRALQLAADNYWKTAFHGGCGRYDGPALAWKVVACKAPDGSYWAVQSWQRKLPDYGFQGSGRRDAWEVHLSHWTGALPVLTVNTDWSWHQWNHLYGTFTYDGVPVFGLHSTSTGQPLDSFGRNLYLDTYDSAYGTGWKRENSFLTHKGDGVFCYSVNPHPGRPAGTGTEYRATIMGPGVTPDVMWQARRPAPTTRRPTPSGISRSRACTTPSAARTDPGRSRGSLPRAAVQRGLGFGRDRGRDQRALFRRWPAGVSVVVAESGGRKAGLTVSSLVSVSLTPPLVSISVGRDGFDLRGARRGADDWGVSILGRDQAHLAQHFARSVPPIVQWDGIAVRADEPRLLEGRSAGSSPNGRAASRGRPRDLRRGRRVARARARPGQRSSTSTAGTSPCDRRVVFDMDGVLVDSEQVWDGVREELAAERGGSWHPGAQRDMMGMSSPEWSRYMHDRIGLAESPEEINRIVVERMLERYAAGPPWIPGALDAVRRIAGSHPLGLASSSNRELIDVVLEAGGITGLFRGHGLVGGGRTREARARRLSRGGAPPRGRSGRLRGGRGLPQRHPLGEVGRDGVPRDPERPLPAGRRGRRSRPRARLDRRAHRRCG